MCPSRWLRVPRGVCAHGPCCSGLGPFASLLFTRLPCCGLFTSQVSDLWLPFDFCLPHSTQRPLLELARMGGLVSPMISKARRHFGSYCSSLCSCSLPHLSSLLRRSCPTSHIMTCQQFSWIAHVSTHNPQASIIFLNKVPFLQLLPL